MSQKNSLSLSLSLSPLALPIMAAVKFSLCAEDPLNEARESPAYDPIESFRDDMLKFVCCSSLGTRASMGVREGRGTGMLSERESASAHRLKSHRDYHPGNWSRW